MGAIALGFAIAAFAMVIIGMFIDDRNMRVRRENTRLIARRLAALESELCEDVLSERAKRAFRTGYDKFVEEKQAEADVLRQTPPPRGQA